MGYNNFIYIYIYIYIYIHSVGPAGALLILKGSKGAPKQPN